MSELIPPMTDKFWKAIMERVGVPPRYQKATLKQCKIKPKNLKPATYTGDVGCGKTHTLWAIFHHYYKTMRETSIEVITWKHFIDKQRSLVGTSAYYERIEELQKKKVLIIDDIATEDVTDWSNELLYSIVDKRYSFNLDTYFSSNRSGDELHKNIGDRTYRRIIEMAPEIEVSYI